MAQMPPARPARTLNPPIPFPLVRHPILVGRFPEGGPARSAVVLSGRVEEGGAAVGAFVLARAFFVVEGGGPFEFGHAQF